MTNTHYYILIGIGLPLVFLLARSVYLTIKRRLREKRIAFWLEEDFIP